MQHKAIAFDLANGEATTIDTDKALIEDVLQPLFGHFQLHIVMAVTDIQMHQLRLGMHMAGKNVTPKLGTKLE